MPIDLGDSGGNRPSRSSRSPTARVDNRIARVRRTDTAQDTGPVMDGAGKGLGMVANSISAFFPGLRQIAATDHDEAMDRIRKENADYIINLENKVRTNPEKAREALETGDYSEFIPENEMKRRRVISHTFENMVADEAATSDFETLAEQLRQVPLEGNPDKVIDEFIKTQTKNSSPVFAAAYGRKIAHFGAKWSAEWKQKRLENTQMQASKSAGVFVKNNVGLLPASQASLATLQNASIAAQPTNSVAAYQEGMQLADTALIEAAAEGDTAALKMITEVKDPRRNGKTIREMYPTRYENVKKQYHAARRQLNTVQAEKDFDDIARRRAAINAGVPDEGDSPAKLRADTIALGEKHGKDKARYTATLNSLAGLTKKAGDIQAFHSQASRGGRISGKKPHRDAYVAGAYNFAHTDDLIAKGHAKSPEEAMSIQIKTWRVNGSPADLKSENSDVFKASDDPAQVNKVYDKFRHIPTNELGRHLDDDGVAVVTAMRDEERRSGVEGAMKLRQSFLPQVGEKPEDLRGDGPINKLKDTDPRDRDEKHYTVLGKKAFNNIDTGLVLPRSQLGIDFLAPDTKVGWDDLTQTAVTKYDELVQRYARIHRNTPGVSLDKVHELAAKDLGSRLVPIRTSSGKYHATLSNMPSHTINRLGMTVPATPITMQTYERLDKALGEKDNAEIAAVLGPDKTVGATIDADTAKGEGLVVTRNVDGVETPLLLDPGKTMAVPENEMPAGMTKFFTRVAGPTPAWRVPEPPGPGESRRKYISNNMFMSWNETTGLWSLRYGETGSGDKVSFEQLDKQRRERLSEAQSRKPRTLRRALDEALEKRRDDLEGGDGPGAPIEDEDYEVPMTESRRRGISDQRRQVLDELVNRKVITPAHKEDILGKELRNDGSPEDEGEFEEAVQDAKDKDFKENDRGDDLSRPFDERFDERLFATLRKHEGYRPTVYDDATGEPWKKRSGANRGNPTVGIGFNLERPDADKLLKKVGTSKKDVMDGKPLTDQQATRLVHLAAEEGLAWLKKHFKDVRMDQNKWLALTSLAYNSKWGKGGPTLIGPNLTKHIKAGDWRKAAEEIAYRSNAQKLEGIAIRRLEEAEQFLGDELPDKPTS